MIVIVGITSRSGHVNKLTPQKRSGKYVLIAPDVPKSERKFEKNYTRVETLKEAAQLIKQGYHSRMSSLEDNDPPDVVLNENIHIFEVKND